MVGVPFYENLGVHYTVTVLGCIAALMVSRFFIFDSSSSFSSELDGMKDCFWKFEEWID